MTLLFERERPQNGTIILVFNILIFILNHKITSIILFVKLNISNIYHEFKIFID